MSEAMTEDRCRKRLRKEVTCSICLNYFTNPMELGCRHNFCESCILKCWEESDKNTRCPECRTLVPNIFKANRLLANLVEAINEWDHSEEREAQKRRAKCQRHQRMLDLFCQDDKVPFCSECDTTLRHSDHRLVRVGKAAQDYKDQLSGFLETLKEDKKKIEQAKISSVNESKNRLKKLTSNKSKMRTELRHLRIFLEKREKELVKEIDEVVDVFVRKRDEHMARVCREYDSVQNFIQELEEKLQQPPSEFLQDIRSILQRYEERPTFEDSDVFPLKSLLDAWDIHDKYPFLLGVKEQFKDTLTSELTLQRANVTLDPDTAHPHLILSEDLRSVRSGEACRELPDNPERFDERTFVLGREEFTAGRHIWTVAVGNEDVWGVGVARKSVRRKGTIFFRPEDGIWGLSEMGPMSARRPAKRMIIWVLVNYAGGHITFINGETGELLTSFTKTDFCGEPLLPIFCVGQKNCLELPLMTG